MRRLSTVLPIGFEFEPSRFLAAYLRLGCGSAQLYRNVQSPPTTAQMLAYVREAGISYDSIHAVFGEQHDPSNPDRAHRDVCLRTYEAEGKLTRDLGCDMAVVHPSANRPGNVAPPRAQSLADQEARWHHLEDFMKRLGEVGERLGVTYLIENLTYSFHLGHDPVELSKRILAIGSPRIRMCFDTGHAHMVGDVATLLEACAPAIAYVHVHDNDSTIDNHRMPGDGTIDWKGVGGAIDRSGFDGYCMLEVFYPESQVERMAADGLGPRLAAACAIRS